MKGPGIVLPVLPVLQLFWLVTLPSSLLFSGLKLDEVKSCFANPEMQQMPMLNTDSNSYALEAIQASVSNALEIIGLYSSYYQCIW